MTMTAHATHDRPAKAEAPFEIQRARYIVLMTLACIVGIVNRITPGRRRMMLCCPPVPEGNRGDQALLRAVVDSLLEKKYSRIDLVQTSYHPIESIKPDNTLRIVTKHKAVFESMQCFKEQLGFVLGMLGAKHVVLVGCDVLDEGYSKYRSQGSLLAMLLAAKATGSSRIIGFSVNDTSSPALFERFKIVRQAGVKLFARDAFTHARLKNGGVEGAQLVGDLAFLLQPAPIDELEDKALLAFIRENQGRLVGLNFTPGVMGEGEPKQKLFDSVTQACGKLARDEGWRFLLIVHDDQGGVEYLQQLHEQIEKAHPGIACVTLPMPPASHLKAIAGQCEQVFTCRLHLAIATLGMGRPITGFPYQGKFEGQLRHFKLDESNLVPPDKLDRSAEGIHALLQRRLAMTNELANQVQQTLPDVLAMSRQNFQDL